MIFKTMSHDAGVEFVDEILFSTPFGYMFPELANSANCRLPESLQTQTALIALGEAMGTPGDQPAANLDSATPSVYTYLGQFIDHDITARTDRDNGLSVIGGPSGEAIPLTPVAPDQVIAGLSNGRRPQLDLDSLYGDGPSLVAGSTTTADKLYEPADHKMRVVTSANYIDLPRNDTNAQSDSEKRVAVIADGRNDENLNVSQLHAAFLAFHNKVVEKLKDNDLNNACGSNVADDLRKYIIARKLVRWAYQFVVINDYLCRVCDPAVTADVVANGPRYFKPVAGGELFMPLEFSVAGFRFGHSMIRPSYEIQGGTTATIMDILGVSADVPRPIDLLEKSGADYRLKQEFVIDWANYADVSSGSPVNLARKIDPLLATGLDDIPFINAPPSAMMRNLAKRNLQRGYLLSIPTGQAVAHCMGIEFLSAADLKNDTTPEISQAIDDGGFGERTPLWYYVLQEAWRQKNGETLGAVGSRLVAETLVGLVKADPNSFLNNCCDDAVTDKGIEMPDNKKIATVADILEYAGVAKKAKGKK